MKREIISIIFCILLLFIVFENFSAGAEQLNIPNCKNIFIEVNPVEKIYFFDTNSNPVVNITTPENGTYLPTPLLEVLGYAFSPDGLNFVEYTWYWNNNLYYYNSSTLTISNYYTFEFRVYYLPKGTHKIVVGFSDIYNHSGSDSVVVYYTGNQPPEKPDKPSGIDHCSIGIPYNYSTYSTDPNNDKIKYGWDWNDDGIVDQWTGFSDSGISINTAHIFTNTGTYNIKVLAEDEHGSQSTFSEPLQIIITSNPPNKPSKPTGSSLGKPGVSYTYHTSTTDPDGDQLFYMWDWADGTALTWDGPYTSGQNATASHIWSVTGTYSIKVKVKDITDAESVWSDPLPVTMPYSYHSLQQFFEWLFQRFPSGLLFLIQLMGYY